MKLAVVGNRERWFRKQIYDILDEYDLCSDDFIVTGGAKGVDSYAMDYAKQNGINLIVFYPSKKITTPYRYYNRNEKIAIECDKIIAFNKKGVSGTSNTISYGKEYDKEVRIIN